MAEAMRLSMEGHNDNEFLMNEADKHFAMETASRTGMLYCQIYLNIYTHNIHKDVNVYVYLYI
jgi:hypothetical protein